MQVNLLSNYYSLKGYFAMKRTIILLSFIIGISFAKDSLYCVNTLVGKTDNRLHNAKAAGDLNGDGYDDLAVMFEDSTYIYFGNTTFELEHDFSIQQALSFPGDVNNDGYADFLFEKNNSGYAAIHVGFGGAQLDTTGILIYEQQYLDEFFSGQVDPLGDVNGDGYNDFVISSPYNWSDGISRVYLYYGGEAISTEPDVVFTSGVSHLYEDFFGHAVTGIGDQNNDGYDDFLISAPNEPFVDSTVSRVYLYYGGSGINSSADSIFHQNNIYGFGEILNNAGDINRDQHTDFFIRGGMVTYLYFSVDSLIEINIEEYGLGGYVSVGAGGDINKDGFNDYLIGNTNYKNDNDIMVGISNMYWGSEVGDINPDISFEGEYKWDEFSKRQDIIGDFNGDGYDDFFIIAYSYPDFNEPKGKLYLYSFTKLNYINEHIHNPIKNFHLFQNYPNPFNVTTVIPFQLYTTSKLNVNIYDTQGRLIKKLFSGVKPAGMYNLAWNGKTNYGRDAASGIYIVLLKQSSNNINVQNQKIILLK
jgi:hypothetical protein